MRQIKLKKIVVATALALSSAVLGSPAYAAGLGRLTVMSGLGQPLKAEIDLTSVSRGEAGTLVARVASPDAYRQAGVEYSASLLNVRLVIDRRADGQYFVRLSSSQPVNDPIVDVLVELTWANGRLLREYTFLLDPVDMKPMQVPAAPLAVPPPVREPKPASVQSPAPAAAPRATAPAPVRPAAPSKPTAATGSYEVKKGDTLGKIARQAQSDGLTLDQMLVALQRANQDAFIGGNVNRLKSGVILTIPDKDAAAAVAPSDARRLIAAQASDWKAYQEKVAGGVQAAPAEKPSVAKQEAKGKITAKAEDKAGSDAAADKLKLSKADPAAIAKGAAKPKASLEDQISRERELRDSKARQAELERNVKDLQKLAEIKNQSLADLQKGAQAKGAQPQIAQGPVTPPPAPAKAAEAPKAEPPKAVAPPAAPKAPEPSKAPEASKSPESVKAGAPAPTPAPPKAAEPPKAPEPAKAAEPPKAVEAPKADTPRADAPKADAPKADAPKADAAPKVEAKPAPKKAAPPPPPPEPSLVDEFLGNPLYLAGGGGVLLLLGGYAAYAVRRKRKDANSGFESSIVTGGDLKANSVFGNTGGQSVDTGHSSFQSDFSAVGSSTVDTDEVDPVAEADVYMAYGRDAQAEEILKEALEKDPNRHTVRLKLLEIYSQRGDANSFGAAAAVMHASTGGQGAEWERAAVLGLQVDPSNSLYGGGGAAAAVNAGGSSVSTVALAGGALAAAAAVAASASDKTVTLPAYGAPGGAPLAADDPMTKTVALEAVQGKTPASIDLDFDLGSDTQEAPPAKPDLSFDATASSKPAPSIDFDLGFGDAPPAAPPAASAPATPNNDDTDFSPGGTLIIDAPLAMEGGGAASPDKTLEISGMAPPPAADAGMSVDFDFDLGSNEPAPAAPPPAPVAAEHAGNSVDFDFGSISLDLSEAGGNTQPAPADDASTKLDLAKAYQEMGDKDGARELLKEVVAEGSDVQKSEAQKLLAELD